MSQDPEPAAVDEAGLYAGEMPITGWRVFVAIAGGLAGVILMVPVLVGLPWVLNLFRTEPIEAFAQFGSFLGLQPTLTLGIYMFIFGGTVVLPLLFLVAGAFLPPEHPRPARGATFAVIFWTGFVMAFWPNESPATVGMFLLVSFIAHLVYGLVLGLSIDRITGMPQHEV